MPKFYYLKIFAASAISPDPVTNAARTATRGHKARIETPRTNRGWFLGKSGKEAGKMGSESTFILAVKAI
jgi:hypothetical protein